MSNRILELVIMTPAHMAWKKKIGENMTLDDITKVVKAHQLDTYEKRIEAQKEIQITLYEEAMGTKSAKVLIAGVVQKLSHRSYCNEHVVGKLAARHLLDTDKRIADFNQWIQDKKFTEKRAWIDWTIDILAFHTLVKQAECEDRAAFKKHIVDQLVGLGGADVGVYEKLVDRVEWLKWCKPQVKDVVGQKFNRYHEIVERIYEAWIHEEAKVEEGDSLLDSLLDMFDEVDQRALEKEQVKEDIQEQAQEEVKEVKAKIKEVIQGESQEQVQEACEEESDKEQLQAFYQETKVLRNLVNADKGAALSELYNLYLDIENQSKGNIEATLSTFFMALENEGFEFNKNGANIGDKVTVHTKDALKEYRFSQPVARDGQVLSELKYYETLYQNKRLTPMVVKPIQ
ncbi:MAG: hypothetical protein ACRCTE_00730 [Cellulosilyticaceae bacterium]